MTTTTQTTTITNKKPISIKPFRFTHNECRLFAIDANGDFIEKYNNKKLKLTYKLIIELKKIHIEFVPIRIIKDVNDVDVDQNELIVDQSPQPSQPHLDEKKLNNGNSVGDTENVSKLLLDEKQTEPNKVEDIEIGKKEEEESHIESARVTTTQNEENSLPNKTVLHTIIDKNKIQRGPTQMTFLIDLKSIHIARFGTRRILINSLLATTTTASQIKINDYCIEFNTVNDGKQFLNFILMAKEYVMGDDDQIDVKTFGELILADNNGCVEEEEELTTKAATAMNGNRSNDDDDDDTNPMMESSMNASVFCERTDAASATQYFQFYGYLSQQQNMMQDYVRTSTYQRAIYANAIDFENKIVLDVGAGSGILSFFAANAGARKVYAIEASNMAKYARDLVSRNGMDGVIEVITGKVEEIQLPEMVDVLISEPMGYMLYNERMLETYLHAKKWLKPVTGKMYPSRADLHIAPFTDEHLYMEQFNKASFWCNRSFHGINLSGIHAAALNEYFSQPIVDTFDVKLCMSKSVKHTVNFETANETDLHDVDIPLAYDIFESGACHGLAFWFDVEFCGSERTVWLSTAPFEPLTHWNQIRCLLSTPIFVNRGQLLVGNVKMRANKLQSYDVSITLTINGTTVTTSNTLDLKNPYFRYTGISVPVAAATSPTPHQTTISNTAGGGVGSGGVANANQVGFFGNTLNYTQQSQHQQQQQQLQPQPQQQQQQQQQQQSYMGGNAAATAAAISNSLQYFPINGNFMYQQQQQQQQHPFNIQLMPAMTSVTSSTAIAQPTAVASIITATQSTPQSPSPAFVDYLSDYDQLHHQLGLGDRRQTRASRVGDERIDDLHNFRHKKRDGTSRRNYNLNSQDDDDEDDGDDDDDEDDGDDENESDDGEVTGFGFTQSLSDLVRTNFNGDIIAAAIADAELEDISSSDELLLSGTNDFVIVDEHFQMLNDVGVDDGGGAVGGIGIEIPTIENIRPMIVNDQNIDECGLADTEKLNKTRTNYEINNNRNNNNNGDNGDDDDDDDDEDDGDDEDDESANKKIPLISNIPTTHNTIMQSRSTAQPLSYGSQPLIIHPGSISSTGRNQTQAMFSSIPIPAMAAGSATGFLHTAQTLNTNRLREIGIGTTNNLLFIGGLTATTTAAAVVVSNTTTNTATAPTTTTRDNLQQINDCATGFLNTLGSGGSLNIGSLFSANQLFMGSAATAATAAAAAAAVSALSTASMIQPQQHFLIGGNAAGIGDIHHHHHHHHHHHSNHNHNHNHQQPSLMINLFPSTTSMPTTSTSAIVSQAMQQQPLGTQQQFYLLNNQQQEQPQQQQQQQQPHQQLEQPINNNNNQHIFNTPPSSLQQMAAATAVAAVAAAASGIQSPDQQQFSQFYNSCIIDDFVVDEETNDLMALALEPIIDGNRRRRQRQRERQREQERERELQSQPLPPPPPPPIINQSSTDADALVQSSPLGNLTASSSPPSTSSAATTTMTTNHDIESLRQLNENDQPTGGGGDDDDNGMANDQEEVINPSNI